MEAPLYLKGRTRKGPSLRETILMHAVSRLVLHPHIQNIQVSWVKVGPRWAQYCLQAGANDMGGTLMNESISRAAGAAHGQELDVATMEMLIHAIGRDPQQRTTLYAPASDERHGCAQLAADLKEPINAPLLPRKREILSNINASASSHNVIARSNATQQSRNVRR
jgi:FO synthase